MTYQLGEGLHRFLNHFCRLEVVADLFNLSRWLFVLFFVASLLELRGRLLGLAYFMD